MELKLEITKKLEEMAKEGTLDRSIAILNLPSANYCEKRGELIVVEGKQQQACFGCVTQGMKTRGALTRDQVRETIDFFAENYCTRFITINGRGDPFHPMLRESNIEKIAYARERWGMHVYVFTAGNNLDEDLCTVLAENEANVMISLFGNKFIDADFFRGKEYKQMPKPFQNQAEIAENLRRLMRTYREAGKQPGEGTTRLGMNYVVSYVDLADEERICALKQAANENGLYFGSNTNFVPHQDANIQRTLEMLARKYTNFGLRHSTAVNDRCQMGAGSSATVDFDGTLLRCPYMNGKDGDGRFHDLSKSGREEVLERYQQYARLPPCVLRPHQR